jgi:hypothetical protein
MNITPKLTEMSITSIQKQILKKNSDIPYIANNSQIKQSITDMDHHPYTRWYRGVYYFPQPIIMEREAGFRPQENQCYKNISPYVDDTYSGCFEIPCTTTMPCNTVTYKENDKVNTAINNSCMVQYY